MNHLPQEHETRLFLHDFLPILWPDWPRFNRIWPKREEEATDLNYIVLWKVQTIINDKKVKSNWWMMRSYFGNWRVELVRTTLMKVGLKFGKGLFFVYIGMNNQFSYEYLSIWKLNIGKSVIHFNCIQTTIINHQIKWQCKSFFIALLQFVARRS